MIEIEQTDVFGWEAAIRGMRNPMNSWEKSDSRQDYYDFGHGKPAEFIIGNNDLKLMKSLSNAGSDHGKFLRMINVTCDITAPLYWWKEFDTYKVGTVANSCSTMHKIHSKEFTLDDFSHEHLISDWINDNLESFIFGKYNEVYSPKEVLEFIMKALNTNREAYLNTKDKRYWWQMIQLLPSSYNQKRTVQLNYQVLKSMYFARCNHKLDEWRTFCDWIKTLPYFEELCLRKEDEGK